MAIASSSSHGKTETRMVLRVRVQRGRRPAVAGVIDPNWRSGGDIYLSGCIGLGIAPAGGDRAGHTSASSRTRGVPGKDEIESRCGPTRRTRLDWMAATKSAECDAWHCKPGGRFGRRSAARKYVGSPHRRVKLAIRKSDGVPPSVCRGGGQKSAVLQFRPRHGAEGINTKMERSKQ